MNKVLIGSPLRNVRISASDYLKAFKEPDPQGAVRVILTAVFPDGALVHCRVMGNRPTGLLYLYPNKVEAIREWLAEMFPKHDLGDNGADWTDCLGVICRVIEGLRSGTGREEA
ncbi:hypothetical protein GJAV_G00206150 [Gymnothorax javanicus]|nr:hypothetical protein GJAV_G00206150 [Gymnothorax javanicus]